MKCKRFLATILAVALLISMITGFSVTAKTGDVLDLKGSETVTNLASATDATSDGRTDNVKDATHYASSWETGEWVATRKATSNQQNATFNSELSSTTAFANGGVLEVRTKMKFDDNGSGAAFGTLNNQMWVDDLRMGYKTSQINMTGGSFKISFQTMSESKEMCSCTIYENTWYTFRALYDFNENKQSFQVLDASNKIVAAGTVDFPATFVSSNEVKFAVTGGDTFYFGLPAKEGAKWYIDDFVINKIDYKYGSSADARNKKFYAPLFNTLSGNSDISANTTNYYWKLDGDSAYWYAKSTAAGQWETFLPNALSPAGTKITSFADGGEMVMQGRFKTNASSKYSMLFQLHPGGIGFKDNETAPGAEREFMAQESGGGSYGKAVIANNAWYTFRMSYNFDTMKRNLIICDDSGMVLIDGTLDIPSSFDHSNIHVYDSAASFVMPANAEVWVDDFAMSKTTHKGVKVSYDNTRGTVTLGGEAIAPDSEAAVAYKSSEVSVFKITPAPYCHIIDVVLDGESLGAVETVSVSNVTEAKNIKVTFGTEYDNYYKTLKKITGTDEDKTIALNNHASDKIKAEWVTEDGNTYWYGYRTVTQDNLWKSPVFKPYAGGSTYTTDEFTDKDMLIIKNKMKFMAGESGTGSDEVCQLICQLNTTNGSGGLGFKINTNIKAGRTVKFLTRGNGEMELGSFAVAPGTWYEITQVYDFDKNTYSLKVTDAEGETAYVDGTVTIADLNPGTQLSFYDFYYGSTKAIVGNGFCVDDFEITKVIAKAVTVNYDKTKGSVTFAGENVVSGSKNAVAYNSSEDAVFSVVPANGYKIKDITVDGESLGNAIDSYNFKNLTADKVMNVEFEESAKEAPSVSKTAVIDTATDYDGNPAALLYVMITSPTDGCVIDNAGVILGFESGNIENGMKLVARDKNNTANIVDGQFGIKVFGKVLMNKTAYMTPYVTYVDADGNETTAYAESEESFTLTE